MKHRNGQTMPELMLAYRASAFLPEFYIPNSLMGCSVEGEAEDIVKAAAPAVPDIFSDPQNEKLMKEASEVFDNVTE